MMPLKKRPFLLLEVVVALILVALVAVPLLRPSVAMLLAERRAGQRLQMEQVWSVAQVTLLQKLYENQIPWEHLEGTEEHPFVDPALPAGYSYSYSFPGKYQGERERRKGSDTALHLKWVRIAVKKGKEQVVHTHRIFIIQAGAAGETAT